ncbi:MAG: hypothetical protein M1831_001423 [Alyxoria varia]|nr:MAG: hypothetical protein M1831_001423 [Alyxoria varia]
MQSETTSTTLITEYVDHGSGGGGRWFIPSSWLINASMAADDQRPLLSSTEPRNVLEAAQLALELSLRDEHFMNHSKIPLVAHQTWKNLNSSTWPKIVQQSVDGWLDSATGESDSSNAEMAYILWDDEGIDSLMNHYEPSLWKAFHGLPYGVEKADTFRVAVLRWFGGIYADVDIKLLQHPASWIRSEDLKEWNDVSTSQHYSQNHTKVKRYQAPITSPDIYQDILAEYKSTSPEVGAIYGIEADTPPDTDAYWRMGYSYPIQLTNWALAMAPHHPTAQKYLEELGEAIGQNATRLPDIDPLDLTGPPALTRAVKEHAESTSPGFQWGSLSGLNDGPGGRGKIVANDVLVLPITGFSPGRSWFHNMGSQSVSHPNARLFHAAAGSWRKVSVKVHFGKFCRTFLGMCRDWKKIP